VDSLLLYSLPTFSFDTLKATDLTGITFTLSALFEF